MRCKKSRHAMDYWLWQRTGYTTLHCKNYQGSKRGEDTKIYHRALTVAINQMPIQNCQRSQGGGRNKNRAPATDCQNCLSSRGVAKKHRKDHWPLAARTLPLQTCKVKTKTVNIALKLHEIFIVGVILKFRFKGAFSETLSCKFSFFHCNVYIYIYT